MRTFRCSAIQESPHYILWKDRDFWCPDTMSETKVVVLELQRVTGLTCFGGQDFEESFEKIRVGTYTAGFKNICYWVRIHYQTRGRMTFNPEGVLVKRDSMPVNFGTYVPDPLFG